MMVMMLRISSGIITYPPRVNKDETSPDQLESTAGELITT
jgi:hypothetical protein